MSGETLFYMVLLVLLLGAIIAFFVLRFVSQSRRLWRALHALRDRIDGTKRWP